MNFRSSLAPTAGILVLCSITPGIFVNSFTPIARASWQLSTLPVLHLPHVETNALIQLRISAAPADEQETQQSSARPNEDQDGKPDEEYDDSVRRGLRRLAQLSLEDYAWRMSLFKEKEADRKMEEYLATMMGDDADYVRPMDASDGKIGPLVSSFECAAFSPSCHQHFLHTLTLGVGTSGKGCCRLVVQSNGRGRPSSQENC